MFVFFLVSVLQIEFDSVQELVTIGKKVGRKVLKKIAERIVGHALTTVEIGRLATLVDIAEFRVIGIPDFQVRQIRAEPEHAIELDKVGVEVVDEVAIDVEPE